jgi:hypothetical protein
VLLLPRQARQIVLVLHPSSPTLRLACRLLAQSSLLDPTRPSLPQAPRKVVLRALPLYPDQVLSLPLNLDQVLPLSLSLDQVLPLPLSLDQGLPSLLNLDQVPLSPLNQVHCHHLLPET